jgi:predicted RNA-binding protein with EMAP domain
MEAAGPIQRGLRRELSEGMFLGRREDHGGAIGEAIEDHRGDKEEGNCSVGLSELYTISFNHL